MQQDVMASAARQISGSGRPALNAAAPEQAVTAAPTPAAARDGSLGAAGRPPTSPAAPEMTAAQIAAAADSGKAAKDSRKGCLADAAGAQAASTAAGAAPADASGPRAQPQRGARNGGSVTGAQANEPVRSHGRDNNAGRKQQRAQRGDFVGLEARIPASLRGPAGYTDEFAFPEANADQTEQLADNNAAVVPLDNSSKAVDAHPQQRPAQAALQAAVTALGAGDVQREASGPGTDGSSGQTGSQKRSALSRPSSPGTPESPNPCERALQAGQQAAPAGSHGPDAHKAATPEPAAVEMDGPCSSAGAAGDTKAAPGIDTLVNPALRRAQETSRKKSAKRAVGSGQKRHAVSGAALPVRADTLILLALKAARSGPSEAEPASGARSGSKQGDKDPTPNGSEASSPEPKLAPSGRAAQPLRLDPGTIPTAWLARADSDADIAALCPSPLPDEAAAHAILAEQEDSAAPVKDAAEQPRARSKPRDRQDAAHAGAQPGGDIMRTAKTPAAGKRPQAQQQASGATEGTAVKRRRLSHATGQKHDSPRTSAALQGSAPGLDVLIAAAVAMDTPARRKSISGVQQSARPQKQVSPSRQRTPASGSKQKNTAHRAGTAAKQQQPDALTPVAVRSVLRDRLSGKPAKPWWVV